MTQAASASGAFELVQRKRSDIIVSDVGMPEEGGHSLMRRIRSMLGGTIPAIALAAYARSYDRADAFGAGLDMHLAKPIDPRGLVMLIGGLVAREAGMSPTPTDIE